MKFSKLLIFSVLFFLLSTFSAQAFSFAAARNYIAKNIVSVPHIFGLASVTATYTYCGTKPALAVATLCGILKMYALWRNSGRSNQPADDVDEKKYCYTVRVWVTDSWLTDKFEQKPTSDDIKNWLLKNLQEKKDFCNEGQELSVIVQKSDKITSKDVGMFIIEKIKVPDLFFSLRNDNGELIENVSSVSFEEQRKDSVASIAKILKIHLTSHPSLTLDTRASKQSLRYALVVKFSLALDKDVTQFIMSPDGSMIKGLLFRNSSKLLFK